MDIAGWKRLETPQFGQQITYFSFETVFKKPDQWVRYCLSGPFKGLFGQFLSLPLNCPLEDNRPGFATNMMDNHD